MIELAANALTNYSRMCIVLPITVKKQQIMFKTLT